MTEKPPFDFEALARSARLDLGDPTVAANCSARAVAIQQPLADAMIAALHKHLIDCKNSADTMVNLGATGATILLLLDIHHAMCIKALGFVSGTETHLDMLSIATARLRVSVPRQSPKGAPNA